MKSAWGAANVDEVWIGKDNKGEANADGGGVEIGDGEESGDCQLGSYTCYNCNLV